MGLATGKKVPASELSGKKKEVPVSEAMAEIWAAPSLAEIKALNVYQRMIRAQGEFRYVQKQERKGLQYATVSHDDVTVKARAALRSAGLYAYPTTLEHGQETNRTWARVRLTIVNVDNPGDSFEVVMFGYGNDNQDKGPGKAISYAVKYCYLKAFAAETGMDADLENVDFEPPVSLDSVKHDIRAAVTEHKLDPAFVLKKIESMESAAFGAIPLTDLEVYPDMIRQSPALFGQADPEGE